MRHIQGSDPRKVGTFVVGPGDEIADIKDAFISARDRAGEAGSYIAGSQIPFYTFSKPRTTRLRKSFASPAGSGKLTHTATVDDAVRLCELHSIEFWSLAPGGAVWGVKDGSYYKVTTSGPALASPDKV